MTTLSYDQVLTEGNPDAYTGKTQPTQHLLEVERCFEYMQGFAKRYDR
jgi:hypothetical protein